METRYDDMAIVRLFSSHYVSCLFLSLVDRDGMSIVHINLDNVLMRKRIYFHMIYSQIDNNRTLSSTSEFETTEVLAYFCISLSF